MKKPRKKGLSLMTKRSMWGWLFVLPFLIGFFFFILSPLYTSFMFSFNDKTKADVVNPDGTKTQVDVVEYVGLDSYKKVFTNDLTFITNFKDSILNSAVTIISILVFSFLVANVLNSSFRGRTVARAVFFLPVITATGIAATMGGGWMVARFKSDVGSGIDLVSNLQTALQSMEGMGGFADFVTNAFNSINTIVNMSGVQILVFLAALQTISPSLFEASDVEGATKWEAFWKITFPMVSPMILVNALYTMIDVFTGETNAMMNYLFNATMYGGINVTLSMKMAMGWSYFLVVAVIIFGVTGIISRFVYYENDAKVKR